MLAKEAFDIAHQAVVTLGLADTPSSVHIRPETGAFQVEFSRTFVSEGHTWSATAVVRVDKGSRTATLMANDRKRLDGVRHDETEPSELLSAKRAYERAIGALGLFNDYDTQGRTEILLRSANYVVTFPLPNSGGAPTRGPDFAMQIRIDAKTGAILEKRVAS